MVVKVDLTHPDGIQNRVVVLETDSRIGVISPDNGASLTDESGEATFVVTFGGTTGAGALVARFDGTLGTVSDEDVYEAVINPVEIGSLDDSGTFIDDTIRVTPSSSLGYRGSVELRLAVGDEDGAVLNSTQNVRVESPCLRNGLSSLSSSGNIIVLEGGVGSVTYFAGESCSGVTDEVTATLVQVGNNEPATATVELTISDAPGADQRFMTFISAMPSTIALAGTGGGLNLEERSQVTFEVRDGSSNPVAGQTVTFELSRAVGGLDLTDSSAVTDSNGQVAATVISGTVATPVRVIATTERSPGDGIDELISVVSDSLSISSGIVTQARFALYADVLNPAAAAEVDGTSITLGVSAYDRFGNAVPDGTTVSFTSECGGVVKPEGLPVGSCETQGGVCFVEWRAQPDSDTVCGGENRVTIMAHALGEETFVDVDGDGYFTFGDTFIDNSEAFRDDNESDAYDAGELFIDLDDSGDFSSVTPGPELFNGTACNSDSTDCSKDVVSVFSNLEIIAGPLDAETGLEITVLDNTETLIDAESGDPMNPGSYIIEVSDKLGNKAPFGTLISAVGSGECQVVSPDTTVENSNERGNTRLGVSVIQAEANDPETEDLVVVSITIPGNVGGSGRSKNLIFNCNL